MVWWSFYESEARFENFVRQSLAYLQPSQGQNWGGRQQLEQLLGILRRFPVLLVLDGFERELRAYGSMGAAYQGDETGEGEHQRESLSLLTDTFLQRLATEPGFRGKVLLTTRLRPQCLEVRGGDLLERCREEELTQMQPEDAVAFFQAQGIQGSRAEIEEACRVYGFHPLCLRLLAGVVKKDLQQPGDIQAAQGYDLTDDIKQRQHHILEQAYNNLTREGRQLLSRIACFRSPVSYEAVMAIAERDGEATLRDLVDRGLVQHNTRPENRFDLHPIVRRYAYNRLGNEERESTHRQLQDYFAAVPQPKRVTCIEDLRPAIELYHHTVRAGEYDQAVELFGDRLSNPLYYQLGAYLLIIELLQTLFPKGKKQTPQLEKEPPRSWTLNTLAVSYDCSGQPSKAIPLFQAAMNIYEARRDRSPLNVSLGNLSAVQLATGALQAAETNLRHAIALGKEIKDEFLEAHPHRELGRVLAYQGAWKDAEAELSLALSSFEQQSKIQSQGVVWGYKALRALLLNRSRALTGIGQADPQLATMALDAARRSLQLAEEFARTDYPLTRKFVRSHWLLGAAHRLQGNLTDSETHLNEALTRCRTINLVESEANILLDLARLCIDTQQPEAAQSLA